MNGIPKTTETQRARRADGYRDGRNGDRLVRKGVDYVTGYRAGRAYLDRVRTIEQEIAASKKESI
jgi:hypothetical protein